jgi:hypothetical protein
MLLYDLLYVSDNSVRHVQLHVLRHIIQLAIGYMVLVLRCWIYIEDILSGLLGSVVGGRGNWAVEARSALVYGASDRVDRGRT